VKRTWDEKPNLEDLVMMAHNSLPQLSLQFAPHDFSSWAVDEMTELKLTEGSNLPAGWTGHNSLWSRLDGVVRSRVVSKTRWLSPTEVTGRAREPPGQRFILVE
jgi:hypothetical protein